MPSTDESPEPDHPVGPADALRLAVQAAQRGDEDAFRTVYRAAQPGLLRYLRVLVGDDAEDVASETWVHIVRDLAAFSGDWDGFRGWSATIARHRAMDHLRSRRRRPSVSTPMDQLAELASDRPSGRGAQADPAAQAEEAIATDSAIALIATLPRDQAEAVLLRAVMGLDARAAAQILGKRPGAVRTAAYRGLRRLSAVLDTDAGPNGGPQPPVDGTPGGALPAQPIAGRPVTSALPAALRRVR